MLKVPGTNTFLKLEEQARNAVKPAGVSKSHAMNTGCFSLPLWLKVESQSACDFSTKSLLVRLVTSRPPL